MDPMILRAVERILAVSISGMSIYLGYRMFCQMPKLKDGEGRFKLPGGVSIYISRVGPGVFFALFGAVVLAISFYQSVEYRPDGSYRGVTEGGAAASYNGMTPDALMSAEAPETPGGNAEDRLRKRHEMEFLNSLPARLETDDHQGREVERHVRNLKLSLMKEVWGPDWGDFELFQLWAEGGELEPAPQEIAEAAHYYRSGRETSS